MSPWKILQWVFVPNFFGVTIYGNNTFQKGASLKLGWIPKLMLLQSFSPFKDSSIVALVTHGTMLFPVSIDILEILKIKHFLFIWPKNDYFSSGANIFQISFTICIIKQIFGEVFTSHIQLVLNIFVTHSALVWRDAFSGPRLWSWPYLQENSWCTVACMLLQSRKAGMKRWFFFGNNFLETIYSFWGRRCQVRFK